MKALIYARVSTLQQDENNSLEMQIRKAKEFCAFKELEIYKIIKDVESGGKDERPGFLEVQEEVQRRSFDVLVVYESSRISRVTLTMLKFVLELQKNNIKFMSISQPELDTTSPTGKMFFQMQATLSEYERNLMSVRISSNKLERAKAGSWQGGTPPYGYYHKGGELHIHEEEAATVKQIFEDYIELQTVKAVALKYGFTEQRTNRILRNKTYLGELPYRLSKSVLELGTRVKGPAHYFKGQHASIIDTETFSNVESLLAVRSYPGEKRFTYIFSALIRCPICGERVNGSASHGKMYYRCRTCSKTKDHAIMEDAIFESIISSAAIEEITSKEELPKSSVNNHAKYEKELKRLEKERERILNLYIKGIIDDASIDKKLKIVDENIKTTKKILEKKQNSLNDEAFLEKEKSIFETLKEIIKDREVSDRKDLKKLFRLLIKEIHIGSWETLEIKLMLQT